MTSSNQDRTLISFLINILGQLVLEQLWCFGGDLIVGVVAQLRATSPTSLVFFLPDAICPSRTLCGGFWLGRAVVRGRGIGVRTLGGCGFVE